MASTLSTISSSRWAGLLEGMDGVAQDAIAQQRLDGPAIHHVPCAIKDVIDVEGQRRADCDGIEPITAWRDGAGRRWGDGSLLRPA